MCAQSSTCLHQHLTKATAIKNGADIAEPHRRYVYDNDIYLVVGKQHKERHMFLFSDILLLTKPRKKKYDVELTLHLSKIKIVDIDDKGMMALAVLKLLG